MAMLPPLPDQLHTLLLAHELRLATAESCTAGRVAAALAQVAGASRYLQGGIIAYATEQKSSLLGVSPETIQRYHVVSEEVARAMAEGVAERLRAEVGIATTGLAGPGGGEEGRPVGMVCLAVHYPTPRGAQTRSQTLQLTGDRETILREATRCALALATACLAEAFAPH